MAVPHASRWLLAFTVIGAGLWSSRARAADGLRSPLPRYGTIDLCPRDASGPRCDTKVLTDENGVPIHSMASPVGGFAPADLQSAYGLAANGGAGQIVAVWGGGSDYPNAESDLGVYRAQYGLPPCTSASGCFLKIDEHGGTSYPSAGTNEGEQAIDMEMVSAACPSCRVMLVEGPDLDVSLATVIAEGASAFSFSIIVSYGSDQENGVQCQNLGYNDLSSGLLITAAMGDSGYPSTSGWVPTACQGTLAVGGTSLSKASNPRGWTESAWSGTGSGCGDAVQKPAWQTDPDCPMRMGGDVSAVADPYTGISFYTTLGGNGWGVVGGTSVATPFTAGALTALGVANGHFSPSWIWQNTIDFYDVTTGSNGTCEGGASYFCTAGPGYDGPTGWGTPDGHLLSTALPPGATGSGATCTVPGGSYDQSCTGCVVGARKTGCTLVCQSCTTVAGTENLGPSLGLPCDGNVVNDNGALQCIAPPDAGSGDAGGGGDASLPSSSHDAGAEGDAGHDGGKVARDAGVPDGGTDASPGGSSAPARGCGCTTAGSSGGLSTGAMDVAGVLLLSIARRRGRRHGR